MCKLTFWSDPDRFLTWNWLNIRRGNQILGWWKVGLPTWRTRSSLHKTINHNTRGKHEKSCQQLWERFNSLFLNPLPEGGLVFVLHVSLLQHTWLKWMQHPITRYQLQKPFNHSFIKVKCVAAGKHLKYDGYLGPRTTGLTAAMTLKILQRIIEKSRDNFDLFFN